MFDPPTKVRKEFVTAGWRVGRKCGVDARVQTDHPAKIVLASFGGLSVGDTGKGVECAKSNIAFEFVDERDWLLSDWPVLNALGLVGIGWVQNEHGVMAIASDGKCFGASAVHDAFYFEGETWEEAVYRSLVGYKSRPILLPGQSCVELYGEVNRPGHPGLYSLEL